MSSEENCKESYKYAITEASDEFEQNQQSSAVKRNNAYNNAVKASNNRFNNFNQRNTDIDSLESELISNNG